MFSGGWMTGFAMYSVVSWNRPVKLLNGWIHWHIETSKAALQLFSSWIAERYRIFLLRYIIFINISMVFQESYVNLRAAHKHNSLTRKYGLLDYI